MKPKRLNLFAQRLVLNVLLISLLMIVSGEMVATHNRAGEIIYEQTEDLTIRATIITYTKTSSIDADRDSLTLYWGDGDSTNVLRSNGTGLVLPNNIKRNEYISEHTYPTRGTYKLTVTDPNRIDGILNIDFPNSVNIRFYIETTFTLLEPRFQGRNNSVILLQPPIDFACTGEVFTYNPNAFDVDGDSLSYDLITPFAEEGLEVPNYVLPDQISVGPDNVISLNNLTGDLVWNAPQTQGEYNVTYRINEHREGELINSIVRDMQILVRACIDNNSPPEIMTVEEICVIAGEVININIQASDPDSNETLSITASGGPFEFLNSPAILETDIIRDDSNLSANIIWQTNCDHVSGEYYQIVVRVTDELSKPMTGLASLRTIRIKVVAPAPLQPKAENENNIVRIDWANPYFCESGGRFQGFSVWRRIGSRSIVIDSCVGGLEGQGYERIIFLTNEIVNGRYIAIDAEINPGNIYCYRIVAEFAELTDLNNPFNRTQSLPSEEVCIRSSGEKPLITNVTINTTDEDNGDVTLVWLNPDSDAIDTTILVGPYGLNISGTDNIIGSDLQQLMSFTYESGDFGTINDNTINISNLDTKNSGHSYKVTFTSGSGDEVFAAESDIASSIFLRATGSDEVISLQWAENVPWNNFIYYVYDVSDGESVLIDSTIKNNYLVEGLVNNEEFCFLIESHGKYGLSEITEPLINFSNESCAMPMDDVAPCPPSTIEIGTICEDPTSEFDPILENVIMWDYIETSCLRSEDIASFVLYFSQSEDEELSVLVELPSDNMEFSHQLEENIAGCYAVTAVDIGGNEGARSQIVCVDNCPLYELPNTFTPNNDLSNDFFVPRVNRFIERVTFEVFNRWGNKVFETDDPQLNWDGTNFGNKELAEGTYYYSCVVFEQRVTGIVEGGLLKGTIQLMR